MNTTVRAQEVRIGIINRGDAALRCIQAIREYNVLHDTGLWSVALHSDEERNASFVRAAHQSHSIGPATLVDGSQRTNAYVHAATLERALQEGRLDAVWVGWGFVAEQAWFAALCERMGVRFIGPSSEALRQLGDKAEAKKLAESLNIPVVPWSNGPVDTLEDAQHQAERIGYPLMLKDTAGGGGRGIRAIVTPDQLAEQFQSAATEARMSSGDATLFLERQVAAPRHIEVQIVGGRKGAVWVAGLRDCTLQRRRQKVLEEAGEVVLPTLRGQLEGWARDLVVAAEYEGVGTVEFLVDGTTGASYFMEVNPRLQVEHTVTETTAGVDLVKLQLDVLLGHGLPDAPASVRGHAIEARITAENPLDDFQPAPGRLIDLHWPGGAGIRVDCGYQRGDRIPPEYDPLVAKIIAAGQNREEALARLARALAETHVVIEGGATTVGFLRELLRQPAVWANEVDVTYLDERLAGLTRPPPNDVALALLLAACELSIRARVRAASHLVSTAARGRPVLTGQGGQTYELTLGMATFELIVHRTAEHAFATQTPDGVVELEVEPLSDTTRRVSIQGRTLTADVLASGTSLQVGLNGHTFHMRSEQAGVVRAPSPAVVIALRVDAGQTVKVGDVLAVLESMKLEIPVVSPAQGVVREIAVSLNEQVDVGDALVIVEPEDDSSRSDKGPSVEFREFVSVPGSPHPRVVVERLLRGFDPGPGGGHALGEPDATEDVGELLDADAEILGLFADISRVTARRGESTVDTPTRGLAAQEMLYTFMRAPEIGREELPKEFVEALEEVLPRFGADSLEVGPLLDEALYRLCLAQDAADQLAQVVEAILQRWLRLGNQLNLPLSGPVITTLELLIVHTQDRYPAVGDTASAVIYEQVVRPALDARRRDRWPAIAAALASVGSMDDSSAAGLAELSDDLYGALEANGWPNGTGAFSRALRAVVQQTYRGETLHQVEGDTPSGITLLTLRTEHEQELWVAAPTGGAEVNDVLAASAAAPPRAARIVELYLRNTRQTEDIEASISRALSASSQSLRVTFHWTDESGLSRCRTLGTEPPECGGVLVPRDLHPAAAHRLELWRYRNFALEHVDSRRNAHLLLASAHEHPEDRRLVVLAEVLDLDPVESEDGVKAIPELEAVLTESFGMIRTCQASRSDLRELSFNRIVLYVAPLWRLDPAVMQHLAHRLAPVGRNLGLDKIHARIQRVDTDTGATVDRLLHMTQPADTGVMIGESAPSSAPIRPLTARQRRIVKLRRRGLHDPYEIVELLTAPQAQLSDLAPGTFQEYDLDDLDNLVPVERPYGENESGIVVGIIRNTTENYPAGMERVLILGDPSRGLGALAEPECRRIVAALDLAEQRGVPTEWFAVSAGAQISMSSGTENMDWVAHALRRIITFTQGGGEINVIVVGVNVGAQPYFNAEATMLMHTRGILIMTARSSMLLTGKEALDFAGGVSAKDNLGIGGYERIMGPNGQAQYWAASLADACQVLFRYYDYTYVAPGELFPVRTRTTDPVQRDVREAAHPSVPWSEFTTLADVFSEVHNPDRKKPFDVRALMGAVLDRDGGHLERWADMNGAAGAVVWEARVGGWALSLVGIEARTLPRRGVVPADGPASWSGSTLFPRSSKKIARALNAASGRRPVVVLANLAGFDGSPESLRELQLEYGAEIGRAVTNFRGPIVFCVVSRYHGGAFVVFSRSLNPDLQVLALEGSRASVIGGSAAAAVVFARDVERRVRADERILAWQERWEVADSVERHELEAELHRLREMVRTEIRAEVAREFDGVHTVERAREVGSVTRIVAPRNLRSELVRALDAGIARYHESSYEGASSRPEGEPIEKESGQ